MDEIRDRLATLETSARRTRLVATTLCVALVGVLLVGAAPARLAESRASAFVLVDDAGRARARLSMTKNGVEFVMTEADGSPRVVLLAANGDVSGAVTAMDAEGRPRIGFAVTRGIPLLQVAGTNGTVTAAVGEGLIWSAEK